jgi:hypothetical protein
MSDELIGPLSFTIGMVCCGLPAILGTLALPFVVIRWWYGRQAAIMNDLKATGYAGEALILKIEPTGIRLFGGDDSNSGIPQWYVTMDVHLRNITTYRVTKTLTFDEDRAAELKPGTVVPVLADPKTPDKIAIIKDMTILDSLPPERR